MNDCYMPTNVLETAIGDLHAQLEKYSNKKIAHKGLLVSYEKLELKEPWSTMPTFYKIKLKNNDFASQYHALGVWSENGQRIEIP